MPKQETLQRQWLKADEQAITSALEALLQVPNGRKFLWWLLEIGRVGQQPFVPDTHLTAFACGELNVGQKVLARIVATSAQGYVTMMQEQANAARDRDTALAGADDAPGRDTDPEPYYPGGTGDGGTAED